MDYPSFIARLADAAVYDPENADFLIMATQALEAAELRVLRELDPILFRVKRDVPLAVVAEGVFAVPADVVMVRNVWFFEDPAGWIRLSRRPLEFLRMYAPVPGTFGRPRYWGTDDGAEITIVPLAALDTTLQLDCTVRPPGMSEANPETWLGTWVPDCLFYAAMVFATGFQRSFGEAQEVGAGAVSWEKMYQGALAGAALEMRRRKADGPWDNSRIPPVSSVAPPG